MRVNFTTRRGVFLLLSVILLGDVSQAELLNWEQFSTPFSANGSLLGGDILFANNQFLAASPTGIYTSPDGVAWTQRSTNWANYIAAGGRKYVAIRASKYLGTPGSQTIAEALASGDGINWSQPIPFPNDSYPGSICFGKGLFVTAGSGGRYQNGSIFVSTNGTNWTSVYQGVNFSGFGTVVFGNGVFAASSFSRDSVSSDGTNWTFYPNGYNQISPINDGLAFGNNEFVKAGQYARDGFFRSSSGSVWRYTNSPSFQALTFGGGKWVTLVGLGRIGISADLNNWAFDDRFTGLNTTWSWLAYGNGRFVILTDQGQSLVALSPPPLQLTISQMVSTHLTFLVSGQIGKTNCIEASSNLVDWASATTFWQSNYDTSVQVTNPPWPNAFFRTVTK